MTWSHFATLFLIGLCGVISWLYICQIRYDRKLLGYAKESDYLRAIAIGIIAVSFSILLISDLMLQR